MLDDNLDPSKQSDNEAQLVVAAARRITGEQRTMKRNGMALKISLVLGGLLATSAVTWTAKTIWGGIKEAATVDVAADVVGVKADVATLKTDVATLKTDMQTQVRHQKADGKVTRAIARKLKIELAPEPAEP